MTRSVLAAASTVGYVRLPPKKVIGPQPTAVKTRMQDILRYVRGVGFAETRKYCYRCI